MEEAIEKLKSGDLEVEDRTKTRELEEVIEEHKKATKAKEIAVGKYDEAEEYFDVAVNGKNKELQEWNDLYTQTRYLSEGGVEALAELVDSWIPGSEDEEE